MKEWAVPVRLQSLEGSGKFIGASAVQGRKIYKHAVTKSSTLLIRPTMLDPVFTIDSSKKAASTGSTKIKYRFVCSLTPAWGDWTDYTTVVADDKLEAYGEHTDGTNNSLTITAEHKGVGMAYENVTYTFYTSLGRSAIPTQAEFDKYALENKLYVDTMLPFITERNENGIDSAVCLMCEVDLEGSGY